MNRGSPRAHVAYVLRRDASMRPRFMNRGSSGGSARRGGGVPASMRPRFMNRGSSKTRREAARAAKRFNEAPIHESGK